MKRHGEIQTNEKYSVAVWLKVGKRVYEEEELLQEQLVLWLRSSHHNCKNNEGCGDQMHFIYLQAVENTCVFVHGQNQVSVFYSRHVIIYLFSAFFVLKNCSSIRYADITSICLSNKEIKNAVNHHN